MHIFTVTENDWLGYWGKHMKATAFKTVRECQKVKLSLLFNFLVAMKERKKDS
jgi:hypothetical protein